MKAEPKLIAAGRASEVFDVGGRRIRTLVNAVQGPGRKNIMWGGETDEGAYAPAGVYVVRLEVGHTVRVRRAVLLR